MSTNEETGTDRREFLRTSAVATAGVFGGSVAPHQMLGITYYNEQKLKSARGAFRAARKFEKSKEHAVLWLEMLDREEKRAAEEAENAS